MPRPVKKGPTGPFRRRIAAMRKAAKKVSKGPAPLPSPRPIKGRKRKPGKPTLLIPDMPIRGPKPSKPTPIKPGRGKGKKPMPIDGKPMKPVKGRGKSRTKFYDMKGNLISDNRKPIPFKKRK